MIWTVKKLMKEFSLPRTSLLRLIKNHNEELKSHIRYGKRNRLEIGAAGKAILHGYLREEGKKRKVQKVSIPDHEHDQDMSECVQRDQSGQVESNHEEVKKMFLEQIEQLKNQIGMMGNDTKRKDETINQLIETHAQDRERTDTIIMKMTQDLEQVRSENQLLLEESKKKEEEKKPEPKKTDRVISIQEFITAKIEEDIEKSNYEAEKKRLKQNYEDPLQGRSALYKIYVKMFKPEILRQTS
ncbi:hypothetical protein KAJ27_14830 [bacterium]|nr:hypothetical protein [bacterium]